MAPEGAALGLGASLGSFAGSLLRVRRGIVERNLRLAFPDRDLEWRRAVARASYRHVGREAVAMLRMAALDRESVRARARVEGLEQLRDALDEGRGAVLVSGHLGNWEIGGAALAARGVPLAAVALQQGNPLFDRELVETRRALGVEVIYRRDAPRAVLRDLRKGRAVALVADQNPLRGGMVVDFFGRPANTSRGPAVLAIRSEAPLFLGVCVREAGGTYVLRLQPVEKPVSGDLEADVRRLVEAYTRRLEEAIREHPQQYFWLHDRWKERRLPGSRRSRVSRAGGDSGG